MRSVVAREKEGGRAHYWNKSRSTNESVNNKIYKKRMRHVVCRCCWWVGHAKFISSTTVAIHEEPGCSSAARCNKLQIMIVILEEGTYSDSFTQNDVYPFVVRKCYDIGKAVKKFKECKRHPWVKTTACMGS